MSRKTIGIDQELNAVSMCYFPKITGNVRIMPGVDGWQIEEVVSESGLYIDWPGLYSSYDSAAKYLKELGYEKKENLEWKKRTKEEGIKTGDRGGQE